MVEQSAPALSRKQAAERLTQAGYPVKASTLGVMASRGGGPPYAKFGARTWYRWDDLRAWAEGRTQRVGALRSDDPAPRTDHPKHGTANAQ